MKLARSPGAGRAGDLFRAVSAISGFERLGRFEYRDPHCCVSSPRAHQHRQRRRDSGTVRPCNGVGQKLSSKAAALLRFPQWHNLVMEITWLGHGTFQMVLPGGETLILDPWTQGNPAAYPAGHGDQSAAMRDPGFARPLRSTSTMRSTWRSNVLKPKVVGIYETCHWLEMKAVANCCCPMNKRAARRKSALSL